MLLLVVKPLFHYLGKAIGLRDVLDSRRSLQLRKLKHTGEHLRALRKEQTTGRMLFTAALEESGERNYVLVFEVNNEPKNIY